MKSGLKGIEQLAKDVFVKVATYAAMKSGLKANCEYFEVAELLVATYAAMKRIKRPDRERDSKHVTSNSTPMAVSHLSIALFPKGVYLLDTKRISYRPRYSLV